MVPPLVIFLAKSPLVDNYDLSTLKHIFCGAAPLKKETEEAVVKRLGVLSIRQGYGCTEVFSIVEMPIGERKLGSSGKAMSYTSCKVRDPASGQGLGTHQIGELCFKGPMVMAGYYNNEEATKAAFTEDGWLLTGDLGYYDEDKYIYVVDRLKDLIKYKGWQVSKNTFTQPFSLQEYKTKFGFCSDDLHYYFIKEEHNLGLPSSNLCNLNCLY